VYRNRGSRESHPCLRSIRFLRRAENTFAYKCHNIRVNLVFTNPRSLQVIRQPGWFVSLHNGSAIEEPVQNIPMLDSSRSVAPDHVWLVLYVWNTPENEFHRFTGPASGITPNSWAVPLDARTYLDYGVWTLKIEITCDGPDRVVREIEIQCP